MNPGARPRTFAFAAAAIAILLLHHAAAIDDYPFDAAIYWALATAPASVPPEYAIRGYAWPLLLRGMVETGAIAGLSPQQAFRLGNTLLHAWALAVLVPDTWAALGGGPAPGFWRRLVIPLAMLAVFPGLLAYPLSDLPALVALWLGVACLVAASPAPPPDARSALRDSAWLAAAGAALAAAYNTRSVYLFAVVLVAGVAALRWRRRPTALLAMLAGAILVTAPQLTANIRLHGIASANPAANFQSESLFVYQLREGLAVQKYETQVRVAAPGRRYEDPAGTELLRQATASGTSSGLGAYLLTLAQHPLEATALMVRHLVNGLDVQDGWAYLDPPPADARWRGIASFAWLLACGLAVAARRLVATPPPWPPHHRVLLAALALPALATLPGAMETRFLLPLQLIAWTAAAAWATGPSLRTLLQRHAVATAGATALALLAFGWITQATQAQLRLAP